jgi:hypothetical protein
MGGGAMTFDGLIDELAEVVNTLGRRSKAAVFWLFGAGLLTGLEPGGDWSEWLGTARLLGLQFITTGQATEEAAEIWNQASKPTGQDSTQLLNSTVICLSTPLGIASDPTFEVRGTWIEHAMLPLVQGISIELFDDVAFPDNDDDLAQICGHPRFQAAANYCRLIVDRMASTSEPGTTALENLLPGASVLVP